mgnify:CR=1 FL=1
MSFECILGCHDPDRTAYSQALQGKKCDGQQHFVDRNTAPDGVYLYNRIMIVTRIGHFAEE